MVPSVSTFIQKFACFIITHMNRNGYILFMFKVSWTAFFALKWPLLVVSVNEKSFESIFSWLARENIFHAIKIWLINLLSKTWLKYEFLLLLVSLQKSLLFPHWLCWGQGRVMFVSTVHQECLTLLQTWLTISGCYGTLPLKNTWPVLTVRRTPKKKIHFWKTRNQDLWIKWHVPWGFFSALRLVLNKSWMSDHADLKAEWKRMESGSQSFLPVLTSAF